MYVKKRSNCRSGVLRAGTAVSRVRRKDGGKTPPPHSQHLLNEIAALVKMFAIDAKIRSKSRTDELRQTGRISGDDINEPERISRRIEDKLKTSYCTYRKRKEKKERQ